MRQIGSIFLIVLVVVNLIASLTEAAPLISEAVFTHHHHGDMAIEAINLDHDEPGNAEQVTLTVATETTPPLCAGDLHVTSRWQNIPAPGAGINDNGAIAIDYGLVIPDDPPRYKLDVPNYDQLRVVLWARS